MKRIACCCLVLTVAAVGGGRAGDGESAAATEARWLAALRAEEIEECLALATEIVGDDLPAPDENATRLFEAHGLSQRLLTGPFTILDYFRWREALLFHELARSVRRDDGDGIAPLFELVTARIAPERNPPNILPWPMTVWVRGTGLCDRQAWVLIELAVQLGMEGRLVFLVDGETGDSPHTLCEIRSDGKSVLADPYKRKLTAGATAENLSESSEIAQALWPDRDDYRAAAKNAKIGMPFYMQDLAPRNRILHERVRAALGTACPRFGIPLEKRFERYAEFREAGPPPPRLQDGLWNYCARLYRMECLVRMPWFVTGVEPVEKASWE